MKKTHYCVLRLRGLDSFWKALVSYKNTKIGDIHQTSPEPIQYQTAAQIAPVTTPVGQCQGNVESTIITAINTLRTLRKGPNLLR